MLVRAKNILKIEIIKTKIMIKSKIKTIMIISKILIKKYIKKQHIGLIYVKKESQVTVFINKIWWWNVNSIK